MKTPDVAEAEQEANPGRGFASKERHHAVLSGKKISTSL